ncbi:glycosyl transferase [Chroococcidiopsis cubana SAG 39.79]|uniref:Glycosyl transferase n=1 Tax=Chroococcidiopsis cubana SAG 39.79 TaxID=388085 RepID=A0AB37UAB5_9CYAN|nr:glycosyltransferase family A protein [Chroococcidiopsis cubana]PSB64029.1 glycosyl transferase family A [Chroococcidiopsis cubana CCALA 043]RUT01930.1 glycosyl transferase [Chroococcidiopsis cubana SAG 39.79]
MPKVSVIIPAYNAMKYLPATLGSLLSQTFDDFEAIVVNDGSFDETEKWVSQIEDPRVKLICQQNKGLAGARNTGISQATGEYIAFLDADDLWEPSKLEKQVAVLEENPEVGLVYTWVALVDEQGKPTGRIFKNNTEGNVWNQLTQHNIVECGSVPLVRRSCFDTSGIFDSNLPSATTEDWDMWLRIASRYPFKVLKEPLVYYRQISTSGSRNWKAMEESFHVVIEKAFYSAPSELLYLKKRSYGVANLCLAWKCLQSLNKDYKQATHFLQEGLACYPQIRFSKEHIRLSLAIAVMRWLGPDGYSRFLTVAYALRRRMVALGR